MYLFERALGVIIYMLLLIFFTLLIYKSNKKNLKKFLIIYLIILSLLAFLYIPGKDADLNRYFSTMRYYTSMSNKELYNFIISSKNPISVIYLFLIGKTHINGLLPAITCFICYGLLFNIFYNFCKKYDISNKSIAISMFLFMETGYFIFTISSIRNMLAFSIIAWCMYKILIEKKSVMKYIIFIIIASLIHSLALVLIFIFLIIILFQKNNNKTNKFLNYLAIIGLLLLFIYFGVDYYNEVINKANGYFNSTVYYYLWEFLISSLYLFFSTYTLIKYKNILKNNNDIYYYSNALLLFNLLDLILIFEYSTFTRLQIFSAILFTPIFTYILNYMEKVNIKNKNYTFLYIMISTLIFLISAIRGNLSGFKFLNFS